MAKDIQDTVRDAVTHAVRDATKSIGLDGKRKSSNPLAGAGGVAAGAGLAALAPIAARMAKRRLMGEAAKQATGGAVGGDGLVGKATSRLGDAVGASVGEKVKETVEEAGGVAGVAKRVGEGLLPGGGGDGGGGDAKGAPGVGKGRRMPVQQSMDVGVPVETCYNQWTQFEDWTLFMHRVTRVSQEDPCTVIIAAKIWAKTKEFTAEIETQRPDERIKWRVKQGISHTGVVTFHELGPRLTRVELTVDVDPGSLLEKAARGMRHIKRAMRADMHRFKAFIEMQELETGAWRGVIEDGELVEDHDPAYDEERDYSDSEALRAEAEGAEEDESEAEEEEPEEEPAASRPRAASRSSSGARTRAPAGAGRRGAGRRAAGRRGAGRPAGRQTASAGRR